MILADIEKGGYLDNETIITNIKFEVNQGELVGLIGSNGAGKSTTLQALMGTLPYVKGYVQVDNYGYVPERPILYEYFTLWEHIDFLIRTVGQKRKQLETKAKELLEIFHLENKIHDFPTNFSKGMQQKVMLILAFLPERTTYILDEPFMGLDPSAMRILLRMIEEYKSKGASILMSTHALDTAEKICDHFVLVHAGKILKKGTLKDFRFEISNENASLLDIFDSFLEDSRNETFI